MKRCKHIQSTTTWRRLGDGSETAFARHCSDCHATLSLGPSNDQAPGGIQSDVYIEIQAARLVYIEIQAAGLEFADLSILHEEGFIGHDLDEDPPPDDTPGCVAWHIGWLVREMRIQELWTHEHPENIDRFDWDPTRPLAEQAIGTELGVIAGPEPEPGVEIEVAPLPAGSHDRIDCPCDHPPGEVGPCGGCNCADGPDGDSAVTIPSVRETLDRQAGVMARLAEAEREEAAAEHASDCDTATDAAFPCNTGCDLGGES